MRKKLRDIIKGFLLTLAAGMAVAPVYAKPTSPGKWLITNPEQFLNYSNDNDPTLANLLEEDRDKIWETNKNSDTDNNSGLAGHYIQVEINEEDRDLEEGESIVIYVKRTPKRDGDIEGEKAQETDVNVYAQPVAMRILGSEDGTDWSIYAHAYFLYRGPNTDEFSTRIRPEGTERLPKYLRFVVTANNTRSICEDHGVRRMRMAEFNILKLKEGVNYTDKLKDRFRLTTDYVDFYKEQEYEFVNTLGIMDAAHNQTADAKFNYGDYISNFKGENGKWTADAEVWTKKFSMPDMAYITKDNDPLNMVKEGVRQPTHITEHELYAVPGDMIALYPFYSMPSDFHYFEKFSHWYNYEDGGNCPYLDFLIDPGRVMPLAQNGYMAGESVPAPEGAVWKNGQPVIHIYSVNDYAEFVKRVNKGETMLNATMESNVSLDQVERILSDYPMTGNQENPYRGTFDGNGYTLQWYANDNDQARETDFMGIFRVVAPGAVIRNLYVSDNINIHGRHFVGLVGGVVGKDGNGNEYTGKVTLKNVVSAGEFTAHGSAPGGLIGYVFDNVEVNIEDCGMRGKSTSDNNFDVYPEGLEQVRDAYMFCGHLGYNPGTKIERCYAQFRAGNSLNNLSDDGAGLYRRSNSETEDEAEEQGDAENWNGIYYMFADAGIADKYAKLNQGEGAESLDAILQAFGEDTSWKITDGILASYGRNVRNYGHGERYYGTVATFFMPRNPYAEEGKQQTFDDFEQGRKEYVIAADYAYLFNGDGYPNLENGKIYEPTINFRHVFRIKDGKAFADENMATKSKNRAFVRKNRRYITARAGVDFQIRFDSPVPAQGTTRSKWYYKASESDYRRICTMDLEVYDADNGSRVESHNADNANQDTRWFYADEEFKGEGSRELDGITYYSCGGGGSYYRMLRCKAAKAEANKRYIVRLVAKDINGNRIKFSDTDTDSSNADDTSNEVWVQEYYISFVDETGASMLTDEELAEEKYRDHRPAMLDAKFGNPVDKIDYDEILPLYNDNKKRDMYFKSREIKEDNALLEECHYFKWPMNWNDVSYSFGYNELKDYNSYMVCNSSRTPQFRAYFDDKTVPSLFDRRYFDHGKDEKEKGFFFYVNAAADPGNMAYLTLDNFCSGTMLAISAWVAEFSNPTNTNANIAFNFQAVMQLSKDGVDLGQERVPIHTFVSGDVPQEKVGKWNHIYYSFSPDISRLGLQGTGTMKDEEGVTHTLLRYEIVLENNAKDSNGADYAIDDIRVYRTRPRVYARQIKPVCNHEDKEYLSGPIKVYMPFDMLLQSIGEQESVTETSAVNHDLYYSFLDKEIFDKVYDPAKEGSYNQAFEQSLVKLNFSESGEGEGGSVSRTFGKMSFSNRYLGNKDYADGGAEDFSGSAVYREVDGATRLLSFSIQPGGGSMLNGKDYYVVIYAPLENDLVVPEKGPTPEQYNLTDECSKSGVLTVGDPSEIIIDGSTVSKSDPVVKCANQSPVVQVKLKYEKDGTIETYDEFTPFDWYYGSITEYEEPVEYAEGKEKKSLHEILAIYRNAYPSLNDLNLAKEDGLLGLTQDMIDYLKKLAMPSADEKYARLVLGAYSYTFPPLEIPDGEDESEVRVVAVPVTVELENKDIICTAPTVVRVKVYNQAPRMLHGFAGIGYPNYMNDVPLRIGLNQIRRTQSDMPQSITGDETNVAKNLILPLRTVAPVSKGVQSMKRIGHDPLVYLVQTDDPEYKDIRGENAEVQKLLEVGEVFDMKAVRDDESKSFITVGFFKEFNIKEGYVYKLRYNFVENSDNTDMSVCDGQGTFTIKVVPDYQKWTGAYNDDWNNDLNWSRVTADDVLLPAGHDKLAFVTDGTVEGKPVNGTERSFVPLDFTKAVIPQYAEKVDEVNEPKSLQLKEDKDRNEAIRLEYLPDVAAKTYEWSEKYETGATDNIRYDMASKDLTEDGDVFCRPWLANECGQIHFNANAWVYGQQHLTYGRAWADVEFDPSRWYMLSSPLQDTYAGDMYMPKQNARQETEKFVDIDFSYGVNDRFAPAVYQRSWNKATANVYEIGEESPENVIVETRWSHVYNDVNEAYAPGAGFSIKADVGKVSDKPERVLMRLPKHDTKYDYYSKDGQTVGHNTEVREAPVYRLTDAGQELTVKLECDPGNPGMFFLAGNPYMSYLDMEAFLKANGEVIEPMYWIMDEAAQTTAVYDPDLGTFIGSGDGNALEQLPPMQGFFVKAKKAASGIELKYNSAMMVAHPAQKSLRVRSDESGAARGLRITLTGGDGVRSEAVVVCRETAAKGYDPAEDAAMLRNPEFGESAGVYTIAGNMATTVNVTPAIEGTEVGVRAEGDAPVTLRFGNVMEFGDDLMLYDALNDTYSSLQEDMEYEVEGRTAGRLYLVKSKLSAGEPGITMRRDGNMLTIVSGSEAGNLAVRVYDTLGRVVRSVADGGQVVTMRLDGGVCIVEASDGATRVARKIMMK